MLYPIPLLGILLNFSLTVFIQFPISCGLSTSKFTGNIVVNHPIVRDISIPSTISSLPCPSKLIDTLYFFFQSPTANTKAVKSVSFISVLYAFGTSLINLTVSSSVNSINIVSDCLFI